MIRFKISWFKLASDSFVGSRGLMGLGLMARDPPCPRSRAQKKDFELGAMASYEVREEREERRKRNKPGEGWLAYLIREKLASIRTRACCFAHLIGKFRVYEVISGTHRWTAIVPTTKELFSTTDNYCCCYFLS